MWVKLDDGFTEHPKVSEVGALGLALHVSGMVYCGRNLTNGYIPTPIVPRLVDLDNIAVKLHEGEYMSTWEDATKLDIPSSLVAAGVWHDQETIKDCERCRPFWPVGKRFGYYVHDYLDYNPSREQVESEREKARERMSRARSGKVRPNIGGSSDNPAPAPDPFPKDQEQERPPSFLVEKYLEKLNHDSPSVFGALSAAVALEISNEEGLTDADVGRLLADVWEWWRTAPPSKRWRKARRGWRNWCRREATRRAEAAQEQAPSSSPEVKPFEPEPPLTPEQLAESERAREEAFRRWNERQKALT
jgi:hypothetical protein